MTREHAGWAAERISKFYGSAVLFREPSRRESYQSTAGDDLPPGCIVVAHYIDGALTPAHSATGAD